MSPRKVRVRFAPSPTGALHIGGVRTALYNYLFARKHGGDFILRIEDTDQTRYVAEAENYIIKSLEWCGLTFDEGVGKGGNHAPYRQSERKPIYKQYADELIAKGFAYYAFDTPEELDAMRTRLQEQKSDNQQYNALTRGEMVNSLTLSQSEVQRRLEANEAYVVRFKMPENEILTVKDIIRGDVTFNTSTLDDKVLFKSDGMPTYHLANIVDDHLMEITHVIRGEEWLPSLPLHVLLYRSLNWLDTMPEFAHLPLLLKPSGKGKLSKRDGDQLGFPVFPLQWNDEKTGEISSGYKESGYFPEAFINMLAFLGWNPGSEQELFSLDELAPLFSLERASKSGAKFDPDKAKWFNHQYLIKKSDSELAQLFLPILKEKGYSPEIQLVEKICGLMKERVNFVKELWEQSSFFFEAPTEYDATVIKKRWTAETPALLLEIRDVLVQTDTFDVDTTHEKVKNFIAEKQLNMGQIMNCLRLSLVGGSKGPDLFVIVEMLGKQEVANRLERAAKTIA